MGSLAADKKIARHICEGGRDVQPFRAGLTEAGPECHRERPGTPAARKPKDTVMAPNELRVAAGALHAFITPPFTAVRIPNRDAATPGELVTEADLRGSDTHAL